MRPNGPSCLTFTLSGGGGGEGAAVAKSPELTVGVVDGPQVTTVRRPLFLVRHGRHLHLQGGIVCGSKRRGESNVILPKNVAGVQNVLTIVLKNRDKGLTFWANHVKMKEPPWSIHKISSLQTPQFIEADILN